MALRPAKHFLNRILILVLLLVAAPALAADAPATTPPAPAAPADRPPLKPEELEQLLAPLALYPDSLLTQVLMASTYPLEIVQADRWAKAHKDLKGDALGTELDKQEWDASVKSMVNFPDVLSLMSDKLDLTIKIGDAFIEQQADVLNTVQKLRAKAQSAGNLKGDQQVKIVVEAAPPATQTSTVVVQQVAPPPQIIKIESSSPDVIYVPTYNPTVVYGSWPYPAYPPYPYYPPRPPGYVATAAISFGVGVACGAAWGNAWGNCNWGRGDVDIDVNRNANFNGNINRNNTNIQGGNRTNVQGGNRTNAQGGNRTNAQGGKSTWQHDPSHRGGVAYRDQKTAQKFGGANQSAQAEKARDSYRGRADAGRQDIARGGADQFKGGANNAGANRAGASAQDRSGASGQNRAGGSAQDRAGSSAQNRSGAAGSSGQNRSSSSGGGSRSGSSGSAFSGAGSSGSAARSASQRGQSSRSGGGGGGARSAPSRSGGGASRGGGGGGGRGGGGGGRGRSDVNLKENFAAVDPQSTLAKVAALPITRWSYKDETGSNHLGPMAQDFFHAFGIGTDDKTITFLDEGGVALSAIQGLNQKLDEKDARIQALEKQVAELKALVQTLAAQSSHGDASGK